MSECKGSCSVSQNLWISASSLYPCPRFRCSNLILLQFCHLPFALLTSFADYRSVFPFIVIHNESLAFYRTFVSPQSASRRLCFNGFATSVASHSIPSSSSSSSSALSSWRRPAFHRPRLLLQGSRGSGLSRLTPAILHHFEK